MHTARWDHSQDLRGKRVAVIGTGASGVQVDPVDRAGRRAADGLPAHARSGACRSSTRRCRRGCAARSSVFPGCWRAARVASQTLVELAFPLAAHYYGRLPAARLFEKQARAYLEQEVEDPGRARQADAALPARLQAARIPQRIPRHVQPRQRPARDDADRAHRAGRRRDRGRDAPRDRRAHPRHRLQGLRPGQHARLPREGRGRSSTSRSSGRRTASRPTRASASPASRTTSRSSGRTATTARRTST